MFKKLNFLSCFASLFLILTLFFGYKTVSATDFTFTRTLKLGSYGQDVRELQKVLNSDVETRIRDYGPGSSGQETLYFGDLTHKAVIKFQEKYSDQILKPNGLSYGNGFVGKSTLGVLSWLKVLVNNKENSNSIPIQQVQSTTSTQISLKTNSTQSTNEVVKQNQKNLDVFLSAIDTVGKKKGVSLEELARIKKQVVNSVSTSTNLQNKFIEIVQKKISQSPKPVKNFFANIFSPFKELFLPKKTNATVGVPFGGAILYTFYCNCSDTWLITLEPLAPSFAALLTYIPESQAFLSFNIPFTIWLLGEYESGVGICLEYIGEGCAEVPSEGLITPLVGSSPF